MLSKIHMRMPTDSLYRWNMVHKLWTTVYRCSNALQVLANPATTSLNDRLAETHPKK